MATRKNEQNATRDKDTEYIDKIAILNTFIAIL
jgi:hypothetical protein